MKLQRHAHTVKKIIQTEERKGERESGEKERHREKERESGE